MAPIADADVVPLRLSDEQLTELLRLSRPLSPDARDVLLQLIAEKFRGRGDVGDGELFRFTRETIKVHRLFDAPDIAFAEGKYA